MAEPGFWTHNALARHHCLDYATQLAMALLVQHDLFSN